MPSQAITQANKEVKDAMIAIWSINRKQGHYKQYAAKERAEIGEYACLRRCLRSSPRIFEEARGAPQRKCNDVYKQGVKWVQMMGVNDKHQITAVLW